MILRQWVWVVSLELFQQVCELQQICQLEWRATCPDDYHRIFSTQACPGNWQMAQSARRIMVIYLSAAPVVAQRNQFKRFPEQRVEGMGDAESSSFTVR